MLFIQHDDVSILSISPGTLFEQEDRLLTRPMGLLRSASPTADLEEAAWLEADPKNERKI